MEAHFELNKNCTQDRCIFMTKLYGLNVLLYLDYHVNFDLLHSKKGKDIVRDIPHFTTKIRALYSTPCLMFFSRFEKPWCCWVLQHTHVILWNYTTWHRFECKITHEIFRVIWTIFFAGLAIACSKGPKDGGLPYTDENQFQRSISSFCTNITATFP